MTNVRRTPSSHWRVGLALNPQADDEPYATEQEAIHVAGDMHARGGWLNPVAVWDDRDEVIHLFLGGNQFTPERPILTQPTQLG